MASTHTSKEYEGDGSDKTWSYTIQSLKKEDIKVSVSDSGGTPVDVTNFTIDGYTAAGGTVTFDNTTSTPNSNVCESDGSPKDGRTIRIYRRTEVATGSVGVHLPRHTYQVGSSIKTGDLNTNLQQSLYSVYELHDQEIQETKLKDGAVTSAKIADGAIVNVDINAAAEIEVSKLKDGTARQVLQTDSGGTGVEWTSNVDVPGTLDVTGAAEFDSTVDVTGAVDFDSTLNVDGNAVFANVDINGGAIDGASVGATAASTGAFTTINASGTITGNVTGDLTGDVTGDVTGNVSGNAGTATKLATARTIAGVSFDGTGNISLNNNAITNGAGYITEIPDETVQDTVGAMFTGNTETGITATYQDSDGTVDLVVGTLNQDTTGTAANATHVTVVDNESTNEENLIPFIEDATATGNVGLESDGDFAYNPSTGTVTATIFKGNVDAVDGDFDGTLEADAITVAGTALNTVIAGVTVANATTAATATDLGAAAKITNSEQAAHTANDTTYFTTSASDARYFNVSTGDTIKDGDSFPDNDTTIATTAAINDRIIDLVDDVGGFVPIATELTFPNANPDVNDGTGTLVSIKALSTNYTSSGSGVISVPNGTVGNSTVTINGAENSTTYSSGFGMIVETTTTLNTYTFHRLVPKATEVTTVATNISNINAVASNETNINAVNSNATNINAVAADATDIGAVAGKATEIGRLGTAAAVEDLGILGTTAIVSDLDTLADISSNITTVAGVSSNVTTVAGIASDVTAVAGDATDIGAVAGKATEIGRLGTTAAVADLALLGTSAVVADLALLGDSAVIADMALLGDSAVIADMATIADTSGLVADISTVADDATDIGTVAGSIANVNTTASNIASVNNFASTYQIASSAPSTDGGGAGLAAGDLYFDTSASELKVRNAANNAWQGGVTATGSLIAKTGDEFTGAVGFTDGSTSAPSIYNVGDTNTGIYFGAADEVDITVGGSTKVEVNSTGLDITGNIAVSGTVDGRDLQTDGTKLDAIEASATADQTAAEIRTAVEAATDSNVFTDADHTKLNGIETSATADQTGAEIKSAYEGESDTNAFTDADHTKLDGIAASANNYTHPTSAGNKHIPTGGSSGQFLKYDSSGTAVWAADNNTTYSVGDGGLTENDFTNTLKSKLDGIATSANNYVHPNHSGEVTSTADGATVIADDIVDEANLKVDNSPTNDYVLTAKSSAAGGLTWAEAATSLTVQEEGSTLSTAATTLNFVGASVTASGTGATKTITITDSTTDSTKMPLAGGTFTGDVIFDSSTNAGQDIEWDESAGNFDLKKEIKLSIGKDSDEAGYESAYYHNKAGGTGNLNTEFTTLDFHCAESRIVLSKADAAGKLRITGQYGNTAAGTVEDIATFTRDGSVELYYDGSKKFDTTNTGVDVTGNIVVSGTVDGIDIATDVAANTAKVTNATHTGEVTGGTALTIADDVVDEANLKVSNTPTNGYVLTAQSGDTGGLTWAAASAGTITALNNQTANRLTTIGSTTTELDGEANLTFDGSTSTLAVTGNQTVSKQISAVGYEAPAEITANWSIAAANNAMYPGPMTIGSGVSVTVPANRTLTIV